VDRFAAEFGVNVIRETDTTITHNLRTAVIGPDGTVVAAAHWATTDRGTARRRPALRPGSAAP
jgi:hypothetical protein